jgi:hypothetical protein
MDCVILRKIVFSHRGRLRWGVLAAQNEGLSLVFLPKSNAKGSHEIVIAIENPKEGVFESAGNVCQFPVGDDLGELGSKIAALAQNLSNEEFSRKFFGPDSDWWKE